MKKLKEFGIPNILSCVRILLIPLFVWRYMTAAARGEYIFSAVILLLSGLTDTADGFIARKFNMITPVGKVLDPIADKLTQATVCVCLTVKYPKLFFILILFILKEAIMLTAGYKLYRQLEPEEIPGSKWFGKMYTVFFYVAMLAIIATPTLSEETVTYILILLGVFMVFAFVMYVPEFLKILRKKQSEKRAISETGDKSL